MFGLDRFHCIYDNVTNISFYVYINICSLPSDGEVSVLLIGLGGGGLATFLHQHFKQVPVLTSFTVIHY
jgi:hypothetical protein